MNIHPTQSDACTALTQGRSQIVYAKLVADLETPVSAMLKLIDHDAPAFLLESVEGGETRGRYSIIGLEPDLIWRCKNGKAEINRTNIADENAYEPCWEDGISSLKKIVTECQMEVEEVLPPIAAGLIGYMGYNMVSLMERVPNVNPDKIDIADACFMRPQLLCVFDSLDGVIFLLAPLWASSSDQDHARVYKNACARIKAAYNKLHGPLDQRHYHKGTVSNAAIDFQPNMQRQEFHAMVNKAKDYIAAGDIFQVVPSQRFSAEYSPSHFALYRSLRHTNPSPFLFYLHFNDYSLIGSSPEILVRLRDDTVTIRPLAGTRKRGASAAEDKALAEDLLADQKETAEHLMLLDLGRNDVGRIAKAGSVNVTQHMQVEKYSHVMHIVSNVEGQIDSSTYDVIDALIAGFPAGTVSGAPKIRAMEIIDELEPEARSFYAGGVGYISCSGEMDTCIALRTALIKDDTLYIQAGAGVVADSDPESEYQETLNKAKALMRAAQEASAFD